MTEKLQPTSMSVAQAARLLTAVGGKPVTEEMIRKDIEAGAPVNPDGTMNVIHYAAFLAKELARVN